MTVPTADDLEHYAGMLASLANTILRRLAHAKYSGQAQVTETLLSELGIAFPPAGEIEKSLSAFWHLAKLSEKSALDAVPASEGTAVLMEAGALC